MGGDFKLLIFKRISRDCKVKKLIFSTRHIKFFLLGVPTRFHLKMNLPFDSYAIEQQKSVGIFLCAMHNLNAVIIETPGEFVHSGHTCVSDNLR